MPILLALCACDVGREGSPSPAGSADTARSTDAAVSDNAAAPAEGAFIGRTWVATGPGAERGTVIVFLADRTFLMDACPGPLVVHQWGIVGNRIRWLEGSIPIEAEVTLPSKNELRLHIVGREPQTYLAVAPPFTCPSVGG